MAPENIYKLVRSRFPAWYYRCRVLGDTVVVTYVVDDTREGDGSAVLVLEDVSISSNVRFPESSTSEAILNMSQQQRNQERPETH